MTKNKVATLVKNLHQDTDTRSSAFQLVSELTGVVSSLIPGSRTSKLQQIISRTTLGFSTAMAIKSLVEIVIEHSQEKPVVQYRDEYFVRVFSNDPLYSTVQRHINATLTKQIAVDDSKNPHVVMGSMNLTNEYSEKTGDSATCIEELPESKRVLLENALREENNFLFVEPEKITETFMKIEDFDIEVLNVSRKPAEPKKQTENVFAEFAEPTPRNSRSTLENRLERQDSFLFKCYTLEERRATQKFLFSLVPKTYHDDDSEEVYRGSADIYVADAQGNGEWSSIPARTADTVILPKGQLDDIVKEIRTFLQHEKLYYMLGVPYHHGIMLSGAPGTGKSSAAQAIASELHMQTYSVSLSTLENNDAFIKFIKKVNSNSVVLIEDIDVASSVSSERTDTNNGVTMETLLNVLDGVLSPHGCVFILTTNHLENIDPAVVRPGRVDATYEISYLVDEQFERLCRKFMLIKDHVDMNLPSIEGLKITPAAIVGVIKKSIPEMQDALPHVIQFVEDARIASLESALV